MKQKMDNLFLNGLGEDPYIDIALRMLCNLYVACTIQVQLTTTLTRCDINYFVERTFPARNYHELLIQLCFMLLEQHIKRLSGKIQLLQS